ncbi:MAG: hypothetical protein GY820_20585, partial [Gammaproteobacteria bacterium]|nr:hypothetical protein [Gammaproteobacteria bacterium]
VRTPKIKQHYTQTHSPIGQTNFGTLFARLKSRFYLDLPSRHLGFKEGTAVKELAFGSAVFLGL